MYCTGLQGCLALASLCILFCKPMQWLPYVPFRLPQATDLLLPVLLLRLLSVFGMQMCEVERVSGADKKGRGEALGGRLMSQLAQRQS